MNHAKTYTSIALATLLLTGCASSVVEPPKAVADEATYKIALSDAIISVKKAQKTHFEWRDTTKILKNADKAAQSGDFETAIKLAQQAKKQAELAVLQSEQQKNAGPYP